MPLGAIYNNKKQTAGYRPPSTTAPAESQAAKNSSPGNGVVPGAITGDFRAGAYSPCSVLGTGVNTDLIVNGVEAV